MRRKSYIDQRGGEDGYFVRKKDVGVIAQEVEKVLPEAVAQRPDGIKAVKYDRLTCLLIEAVKQLRGSKGTKVNISIMREGEKELIDYTITRDVIKIISVTHIDVFENRLKSLLFSPLKFFFKKRKIIGAPINKLR